MQPLLAKAQMCKCIVKLKNFCSMGKIVGTDPSVISGSVGMYTYRQTKDGTIVSEKVKDKGAVT